MNKNPESHDQEPELSGITNALLDVAKRHPVIARWVLVGLAGFGIQAVLSKGEAPAPSGVVWAQTVENPDQGTVPEPRWDTFKFGLSDENGVNPDDAMISAFRVLEDGTEDRVFGPSRMEKDQEYHVAGFPVLPGQDVKFVVTTGDSAEIHTVSSLDNDVDSVEVSNPSDTTTDAVFNINTDPEGLMHTEEDAEPPTTTITTTLDTRDGQNEAMKVEVENPDIDLAFQMKGLITGTIGVDVQGLTDAVNSAQTAGTELTSNVHLGTVSGNSQEGLAGTLEMNGKTYTIDSDSPFNGKEDISFDPNGNLVISNYDTEPGENESKKVFLPSLNR